MPVDYMQTPEEFNQAGLALSREVDAPEEVRGYFIQHRQRLYHSCQLFGLFNNSLGDVLEIGPYYSYTPFILQRNATSYTVLEGDDPTGYPLRPLYERRKIKLQLVDLFEMFGPVRTAPHRLPFADASFDTVMCWGTMEHFNFNPAKFVREVRRVLKPGGRALMEVPNKASLQNLAGLVFGRYELNQIAAFYRMEDYVSNGKKAYYGFHWREYTLPEFTELFARAGFTVRKSGTFITFQNHGQISLGRELLRLPTRLLGRILPRFGTDVYVIARKN